MTLPAAAMLVFALFGILPTQAEINACTPSAKRFCASVLSQPFSVLACLKENRAKIAPKCRAVLERHGQ